MRSLHYYTTGTQQTVSLDNPEVACSSEDRLYLIKEFPGDFSGVEPPVPIPNTEVKRSSADDT